MPATRRRLRVDAATRPLLPRHVRMHHDARRGLWVLLAPERVLTPDAIAVEVLGLCDGTRTVADIAEVLAGRYAAPPRRIAADVLAMLQDLAEKDFLDATEEHAG
jgi:pyrroloquinoline quinone biosynthesis protein D